MTLTTRGTLLALPHSVFLVGSIDIDNPFFIFHLLKFEVGSALSVAVGEAIFASVAWKVVNDVVAV